LVAWTCKVKSENIYLHSLHYLSVERRRAWGGHTPLPCINLPLAHGSLLPRTRHSSGDVLAPPRNHYIGASPSSFPSLSSPPVEPSTHYNPSGVCRRAGAVVEGVWGSAARMLLRLIGYCRLEAPTTPTTSWLSKKETLCFSQSTCKVGPSSEQLKEKCLVTAGGVKRMPIGNKCTVARTCCITYTLTYLAWPGKPSPLKPEGPSLSSPKWTLQAQV